MSQFWSSDVHDLTPYTPGEQPQVSGLVKLNTNENPYAPSPRVLSAIAHANTAELRKYPDPNATELKQAIADYTKLEAKQVFVANSSDEVLAHTFRAFFKQSAPLLYPDITYSFYPVYCQLFGIDARQVPLRDDFTIHVADYFTADTQINGGIIFANPNAPTGIALSLDDITTLLDNNTDSVVVIDEAYADFSNASAVNLIDRYENLLITQTLSKSRALAGLRVGFALGNAQLIAGLERVKNSFHPYTLDALALAGSVAALEDKQYFATQRDKIIHTRAWTTEQLIELGFTVLPSQANFVFATHPTVSASQLFQSLRAQNILIRHFNAPRIEQYIRITIGTDEQMTQCINVLSQVLSQTVSR